MANNSFNPRKFWDNIDLTKNLFSRIGYISINFRLALLDLAECNEKSISNTTLLRMIIDTINGISSSKVGPIQLRDFYDLNRSLQTYYSEFVAKKKEINENDFLRLNKIALIDTISDPGNLGTIIRSAAAFGIEGIILFGNCVDLYSSKVIRSCTGNFLKTPILKIKNTEELKTKFKNHKLIATALSEKNNISLKECAKLEKYIIMLGSEAKGLCSDLINIADKNIRIEMDNNVESLNLSVCASIIFYELFINC